MAKAQKPAVLFVGAGMAAECHQRALTVGRHARLAGIVEPHGELAQRRADEWHCQVYESYAAALTDTQIDAVFILAPSEAHEELALAALEAGKPVLIEKPVASPAGIQRLQRAAEERGLVCMPGHNYAYQPEFTQLRRLVRDGSLGQIRAAWITYAIKHPEEVARHYGGVLDEVMIHHTYLGLALFGPPTTLYAGRMEAAWQTLTVEDQAWMTWQYPRGTSLHHFASFAVDDDTSDSWMFVVKVLGTKGGGSYSWRHALFQRPLGSLSFAIPAYEDSYIYEQQAFFAALEGDSEAIVSPLSDAYQAALLLDLAGQAARQERAVRIE